MFFDSTSPCILKPFNAIRCKDQVHVERAIADLNEVLAAPNFVSILFGEREAQLLESTEEVLAVLSVLVHIESNVLCGIRITEQDCPGLSEEEIFHTMLRKYPAEFLRAFEFKGCHVAQSRL